MTTGQLALYNRALRFLGERKLADLTEAREPRRLLDDVWDDDFVRACLEAELWTFATRTVKLDYTPSVEPDFGYNRAFLKPSDWVRTAGIASDEFFHCPLTQYEDERGYLYASIDILYCRYISDDPAYGGDLSLWPSSMSAWAACSMAVEVAPRLTQSQTKIDLLEKKERKLRGEAAAIDAQQQPARFPPVGSWVRARRYARYVTDPTINRW